MMYTGAQWECQHLNFISAHFRLFHWSNFSCQVFFSRQYNLYFHEDVFCNSNSNKTFNTRKKWKKYLAKIFLFGLWETFTWLWETSAFINCLQLLQKVYETHQEILQPLENKLVGASNPSLCNSYIYIGFGNSNVHRNIFCGQFSSWKILVLEVKVVNPQKKTLLLIF